MWIRTHDDQLVNLSQIGRLYVDNDGGSNPLSANFPDRVRSLFAFEGADSQERMTLTFDKIATALKEGKPYCDVRHILRGDEEPEEAEEPLNREDRQNLASAIQDSRNQRR